MTDEIDELPDDIAAPNCATCLEPMMPDDGAWSWRCDGCGTSVVPG